MRDARIMKMGDGGFRPAFNVQFATTCDEQVIVGMDVINDQAFIQSVLRVNNVPPGNPVPTALTYHNRRLRGDAGEILCSTNRLEIFVIVKDRFEGDWRCQLAMRAQAQQRAVYPAVHRGGEVILFQDL